MATAKEKMEKAMQDILKLQIEGGIRDKEIERLRAENEILKTRMASLPTRYEYWMGVIALIAVVISAFVK
mgnify:CR=1 FL=1